MDTKAKKDAPAKKDDTKAKAATKEKDVAESKADTKTAKSEKQDKKTTPKADSSGEEFRDFFVDELKDILWAEKALLKALPKMSKASTSSTLAASFDTHLKETENQISVLEQVFELMGEKPKTKKCDAMEGLIKETESIISDTDKGSAIKIKNSFPARESYYFTLTF